MSVGIPPYITVLLLGTLPYVDNMAHVGRYTSYITVLLLGTLPYVDNMAHAGRYTSLQHSVVRDSPLLSNPTYYCSTPPVL